MATTTSAQITEARLQRSLRTVANVIKYHGDAYWPIFEALKAELDQLSARKAQLAEFQNTQLSLQL